MKRLSRDFFAWSTETVAKALIGCRLKRIMPDGADISGLISETEAYLGGNDTACHTSKGKTRRNEVMFGPPGYFYVYLTYGMYHMLNIVSEPAGNPCAVLIRGVIPETGLAIMQANRKGRKDLANGPGKLTRAYDIDGQFNGIDMINSKTLFITSGISVKKEAIKAVPRIGIAYAEKKDREAFLRFVMI